MAIFALFGYLFSLTFIFPNETYLLDYGEIH